MPNAKKGGSVKYKKGGSVGRIIKGKSLRRSRTHKK